MLKKYIVASVLNTGGILCHTLQKRLEKKIGKEISTKEIITAAVELPEIEIVTFFQSTSTEDGASVRRNTKWLLAPAGMSYILPENEGDVEEVCQEEPSCNSSCGESNCCGEQEDQQALNTLAQVEGVVLVTQDNSVRWFDSAQGALYAFSQEAEKGNTGSRLFGAIPVFVESKLVIVDDSSTRAQEEAITQFIPNSPLKEIELPSNLQQLGVAQGISPTVS